MRWAWVPGREGAQPPAPCCQEELWQSEVRLCRIQRFDGASGSGSIAGSICCPDSIFVTPSTRLHYGVFTLDPDPSPQSPAAAPARSEETPRGIGGEVATILSKGSYGLFAIFAILVVFQFFPVKLLDPDWLISLAGTLVNVAYIPLSGVMFLHLAAAVAPLQHGVLQQRQLISRVVSLAALGYLLLLPLLGYATWAGINRVVTSSRGQAQVINRNADQLLQQVDQASTANELKQAMVRFQGPQIVDQDLTRPIEQLKQDQRRVIQQLRASFLSRLPRPDAVQFQQLYAQTLRSAILALITSLTLASLVWDSRRKRTLLEVVFRRGRKSSLASSRSSAPVRGLASLLQGFFKKDARTEERKRFWSGVRDKDKRANAERKREIKRNAQRVRQQQQSRELDRLRRERERNRARRRGSGGADDR